MFAVHEALLRARLLFFKNCLSGAWKESEERLVKLPEDEPAIFLLYIQLLYTGQLAYKLDPPRKSDHDIEENITLGKLYVLAEKLQDDGTKERVIDGLVMRLRDNDGKIQIHVLTVPAMCKLIYGGTPGPCGIRRLLVDYVVYGCSRKNHPILKVWDRYPKEFQHDVVAALIEKRPIPSGNYLRACNFSVYYDKH